MRFYVRVLPDTYGDCAVIVLFRRRWQRFYQHGIHVATLNLAADDAEHQLSEARAKAASLAQSLAAMDGSL